MSAAGALATARSHWLTRERAIIAALSALTAYVVAYAQFIMATDNFVSSEGVPVGSDFVTFWAGAKMALEGRALAVFDMEAIFAVEAVSLPGADGTFMWNYPPLFHLIVLPFGMMSYLAALVVWWTVTIGGYTAAMRPILRAADIPLIFALAPTVVLVNIAHGQNGVVIAALFGLALHNLLKGRQVTAGILIGLMAFKPHLAMLVPIAFAAGGYWRAFWAAAVTVAVFVTVATGVFGLEYWDAFIANLSTVKEFVANGRLPQRKLVSLYVLAIGLGAGETLALAIHAAGAVAMAALVGWLWRRDGATPLTAGVLLIANLFVSPYVYDYDMVLAVPAMAFLIRAVTRDGWRPFDREVLVFLALCVFFIGQVFDVTGLQSGPLIALLALWLIVRRTGLYRPPAGSVSRPSPLRQDPPTAACR